MIFLPETAIHNEKYGDHKCRQPGGIHQRECPEKHKQSYFIFNICLYFVVATR